MNQVALLETIDPMAGELFVDAGFQVETIGMHDDTAALAGIAERSRALGIRSKPALTTEIFAAGTALEAIGCYCIGTDRIDMKSADAHGVAIFNSRYENTRSVADLTIGSIIALMRRTVEHNQSMHDGVWSKTEERSYEVRGKTLGIIGYGSIGSQVSVLAENMGMTVKYYDPDPKFPSFGKAERVASLDDLLGQSDVVSLHVPGTPKTKNMINAQTLAAMKPGSYLINTSRGDVVDYEALRAFRESEHLLGVAVDVFSPEPNKRGDVFEHTLRGLPNVLLTPHIAGSTIESSKGIARDTTGKLLGYLNNGNTVGSVNLPEVSLEPVLDGRTRVLHIHENLPGVEAAISDLIAGAGLNKAFQILQTRGELGYVAIDVEGQVPPALEQKLATALHTIRLRLIQRTT